MIINHTHTETILIYTHTNDSVLFEANLDNILFINMEALKMFYLYDCFACMYTCVPCVCLCPWN